MTKIRNQNKRKLTSEAEQSLESQQPALNNHYFPVAQLRADNNKLRQLQSLLGIKYLLNYNGHKAGHSNEHLLCINRLDLINAYGVYATAKISKGTILGGYYGQRKSYSLNEEIDLSYFFRDGIHSIDHSQQTINGIDAIKQRNFTAFVNGTPSPKTANIDVIYNEEFSINEYIAAEDIEPGEQLMLYYGEDYKYGGKALYIRRTDNHRSSQQIYDENQNHYQLSLNDLDNCLMQFVNMQLGQTQIDVFVPNQTALEKSISVDLPWLLRNQENGSLIEQNQNENITSLMMACWQHNEILIKQLLDAGANPNIQSTLSGYAPYHFILLAPNKSSAEKLHLIETLHIHSKTFPVFFSMEDKNNNSLLSYIFHSETLSDDDRLEWLKTVNTFEITNDAQSIMHHAILESDNLPTLKNLTHLCLKAKVDINSKDQDGYKPLDYLCIYKSFDDAQEQILSIDYLLECGATFKNKKQNGTTLLHNYLVESSNINVEMIEKLISLKIQVNAITDNGFTALHLSFLNIKDFSEKTKACDALINAGANIDIQTFQKDSLLSFAISRNDVESVVYLLRKEDEIGLKNYLDSRSDSKTVQDALVLQHALQESRIANFRPQISLLANNSDDVIFQCIRQGRATILQLLLPYLIDGDYEYYYQQLDNFKALFSNSFTHNAKIELNNKTQIISDLTQLFKNRLEQIGSARNLTKKYLKELLDVLEKTSAKIPSENISRTKRQKRVPISAATPSTVNTQSRIILHNEPSMKVQHEDATNSMEIIDETIHLPKISGDMLFSDLISLVQNHALPNLEFTFNSDASFYRSTPDGFYRVLEMKINNGYNAIFISSSARSLAFSNLLIEYAKQAGSNYFNVDYLYNQTSQSYKQADCIEYIHRLKTKTAIFLDERTLPISLIIKCLDATKNNEDLPLFFSKTYENETILSFTQASSSIEDKLIYINNQLVLIESNFDKLKPIYYDMLELCIEQLETLLSLKLSIQQQLNTKKTLQETLKLFIHLNLRNLSTNTDSAIGRLCHTPLLDPGLKLATLLDIHSQLQANSASTVMRPLQLVSLQIHINYLIRILSNFLFETRTQLFYLWFSPYLPFTVHVDNLVYFSFILENLSNMSENLTPQESSLLLDLKNILLTKKLMLVSNMKAQIRLSLPEGNISIDNIAIFMQNVANLTNDIKYANENIGEFKATVEIDQLLIDIKEKEQVYRAYFLPLIEYAEAFLAATSQFNLNAETYPKLLNAMTMISCQSSVNSERKRASNIISEISQLTLYQPHATESTTSTTAPTPVEQGLQCSQYVPHISFFGSAHAPMPILIPEVRYANCNPGNQKSM